MIRTNKTDPSQQRRFGMVANKHLRVDGSTSVLTRPVSSSVFRCIQSGLGTVLNGQSYTGGVWSPEEETHHINLPRVAGCLPGNQGFQEDLAKHHSLAALGKCNSSELHKPERGHSVQGPVRASNINLDLVHTAKHYPGGRAPSWPTERSSRPGVQDHKGSLRLEAETTSIPANSGSPGSSGGGPFCIAPDKSISSFLQLETRPGSGGNRCFHARLDNMPRVCQPSMVFDSSLPY